MARDHEQTLSQLQETVKTTLTPVLAVKRKAVEKLESGLRNGELLQHFRETMRVPDVWRRCRCASNEPLEVDHRIECSRFRDICVTPLANGHRRLFKSRRPIVFLLESPHRDEYCRCHKEPGWFPIAPAQGATGLGIDQLLMLEPPLFDKYPLILCNPIPWQTSLGSFCTDSSLCEDIRNNLWRALWELEEVQKDFYLRVRNYHPILVINGCTNDFKKRVTKVLLKGYKGQEAPSGFIEKDKLIDSPHPSSTSFEEDELLAKIRTHLPLSVTEGVSG